MRSVQTIAALAAVLSLTACATMFGNSNDPITIRSSDADAKILVNGNEIGRGSASYSVPAGKTVTIAASKKGCADGSTTSEKSIRGATWLNVFFWPGLFVDLATGSLYKADPADYTVNPHCNN